MINLPIKTALIIPTKDSQGKELDKDARFECYRKTASKIAGFFGGYTAIQSKGGFVGQSGQLVEENTTILESFTDKVEKEAFDFCLNLAREVKEELSQEGVFFQVNGKAYIE